MLIVKFRGLIDKIIQVLSTIIMGVMVIAVCLSLIHISEPTRRS